VPQKTILRKAFALSSFVLAEQICVQVPAIKTVQEVIEIEHVNSASAAHPFSLFFEITNFPRTLYNIYLVSRQFH